MSKAKENQIISAYQMIQSAEYILIGAGAGLSAAAGLNIGLDAVRRVAPEYEKKNGITNLYEGSFYPFQTLGERFAFWSRAFYYWRYQVEVFPTYRELLRLLGNKNYFVITTNGDGQFLRAGFPREKVFLMQGDHGDFACSASCCDEVYDAKPIFESMIEHTENFSVPESYLPKCPHCGAPLMMRQRSGVRNLEIKPYREEMERYREFLSESEGKKLLLLELGVGFNTPTLIKIPFWQIVASNDKARYVCVNQDTPRLPEEVLDRSVYIQEPCDMVISQWLEKSSDTMYN